MVFQKLIYKMVSHDSKVLHSNSCPLPVSKQTSLVEMT